ncbi:hypothetical protein OG21DRAFT_1514888 [Imleria badia]|nr:hypothetical protein OG21DRAFT_1514888 [Imleria badia]
MARSSRAFPARSEAHFQLHTKSHPFPHYIATSGPPDGKYVIILASAPPPFPLGVDEGGAVNPIIVGGMDHVWTVRKLEDGNYTLALEEPGALWFSQAREENVTVSTMPPPTEWAIHRQKGNIYSIEVATDRCPTTAWTLDSTLDGSKVRKVMR